MITNGSQLTASEITDSKTRPPIAEAPARAAPRREPDKAVQVPAAA
jgi:hypothetical protein